MHVATPTQVSYLDMINLGKAIGEVRLFSSHKHRVNFYDQWMPVVRYS